MITPLSETWPAEKKLVFGVGCGRTGSESLGYLLHVQPEGWASHEFSLFCAEGHRAARFRPPLAWDASQEEAADAVMALSRYNGNIVGDASSSWLPHLGHILQAVPAARAIVITRPRDAVVRSFLEKSGDRNHWMRHDGVAWQRDPIWDPAFPKYDTDDKADAIGRYWDDYYAECDRLAEAYPDRVRAWPLPALSDPAAVREMLGFAGHAPDRLNLTRLKPRNQRQGRLKKLAKSLLGRD